MKKLAEEIINGRRIGSESSAELFLRADLSELCEGADNIRRSLCGDHVSLCSIINGKSGRCPENCRFCAQSAHNCTGVEEYPFSDAGTILNECRHNESMGVHRFAIVTAGRALSGADFDKAVSAYRILRRECKISLCASHGLLTDDQFEELRRSGVERYHCNLETSRRYFPEICTTHTYDDKIACIKRAQTHGFRVCSGGIIGMGETWQDRFDMALELAGLDVDSVPINALVPVDGTPLGGSERLSEEDILRTAAMYRYILPEKEIRIAAGRCMIPDGGAALFRSGVNATITGDMLTTAGISIQSDTDMLSSMGFDISFRE